MATDPPAQSPTREIHCFRLDHGRLEKQIDYLSTEEPLEIILCQTHFGSQTVAITMRTPGQDLELAAGFLFSEGIIKNKNDIENIEHDREATQPDNTVRVTVSNQLAVNVSRLQKNFFTHSSCGICGKTSMQALEMIHQPDLPNNSPLIDVKILCQLPETLRKQQQQFAMTGGVHSAALFASDGSLLQIREDVGRHNALDKLIGSLLLGDALDKHDNILLVSGRTSFELVQKALMADFPLMAAIGAPSSLAVQLASRHNMTLIGFLKTTGFNVYSGSHRLTQTNAN